MVGKTSGLVVLSEHFIQGFELAGESGARLRDTRVPGFGVTIGRRRVTFVVQGRGAG